MSPAAEVKSTELTRDDGLPPRAPPPDGSSRPPGGPEQRLPVGDVAGGRELAELLGIDGGLGLEPSEVHTKGNLARSRAPLAEVAARPRVPPPIHPGASWPARGPRPALGALSSNTSSVVTPHRGAETPPQAPRTKPTALMGMHRDKAPPQVAQDRHERYHRCRSRPPSPPSAARDDRGASRIARYEKGQVWGARMNNAAPQKIRRICLVEVL